MNMHKVLTYLAFYFEAYKHWKSYFFRRSSIVYGYVGGGAGGSVGISLICICCYYKNKR